MGQGLQIGLKHLNVIHFFKEEKVSFGAHVSCSDINSTYGSHCIKVLPDRLLEDEQGIPQMN